MKSFDRLIVIFLLIAAVMFATVNIVLSSSANGSVQLHNVEVNRISHEIEHTGEIPDISLFGTILGVYEHDESSAFFESDNEYVIREINGKLYRIEYEESHDNSIYVLYVNIALGMFTAAVTGLLIFVRFRIIKPFSKMTDLPFEIAKGNLTTPLKESPNRYFGKFIWGLDMLRESTEKSKRSELELQKEKKTMLMSLSHDIKTPLSAIKLYSAALSKGIYTDAAKQKETADNIGAKADEIEKLVNEIMRAQRDDIIHFDIKNDEFYLSPVITGICAYYRDRLTGTEFTCEEYGNCILYGDPDRLTEVLQNIIENAIKYGDGHYIRLTFSDEEDCRLITVTNSGCTLPEQELVHIFDSFKRGSNVGSKSGSGLGLYICRQLMDAMKGDVFAEIQGGDMCVTVVCRKG